ncbi:MAG: DUF1592 domain-containing protein [Gammaproteobacteria bacterium]|nr:DUF1592 domain-containing protein [Gammaproteobacteria bacterium]
MTFAGLGALVPVPAFEAEVASLVQEHCIACHTGTILAPLDLAGLGYDIADPATFGAWARVYERLENGEMPPAGALMPDADELATALASMKESLLEANLAARNGQRTPLRRLTRLEYGYTIQDLLGIDEAQGMDLIQNLPAEADTGRFDTVAAKQGISALHVRSYLDAADRALDAALALGPRPKTTRREIEYAKSGYMNFMHTAKILGGGITKRVDDRVVMFYDAGSTYMLHTETEGYAVPYPGRYRVTMDAKPYQADTPVVLTLYQGVKQGTVASLDDLIGTFDLLDDAPRTVEVTTFMRPGDLLAPSVAELDRAPGGYVNHFAPDKTVANYKGEGIAIKSLTVEGPLIDEWPPQGTRRLLPGLDFDETGQVHSTDSAEEHVLDIVRAFATRAFRRPLKDGEAEAYADLAEPSLAAGAPLVEAARVPMRAILSAPPFLYQTASAGPLDDFALAARLSYFLWRSMPDDELFELAGNGELSEPGVLASQVDRMLDDDRSKRFVKDFAGQAFRLYEMNRTTPDRGLYPEYDDRLGKAMAAETELFLEELIDENHGVGGLVDADFTYVNRRLAEHYGIPGIKGQQMRRVELAADSPRGGLLTHASIHKITANGTVTSPVPRGNFVLANILGRPAPPPPPGVEGLEPDIRGTTTIREQLTAHRANAVCNSCHQSIDPPGFALESFDPIGGFRKNYRATRGEMKFGDFTVPRPYGKGPAVDPSGVTPTGDAFADIEEYKAILLDRELDQIARHFAAQLITLATGAEVEFADRDEVHRIVTSVADRGYPVRSIIHEVVQSDLFRSL